MSDSRDIVEVLRRPLETISQCRRMLYVTAEVAEIAAAEIVKLREERRSISTLHQKVESLEAEIASLRELLAKVRPAVNRGSSRAFLEIVEDRDAQWLAALAAVGCKEEVGNGL